MREPVVSVILPVYNGEKHLNDCLESILKQTFENFELLVINDGSNDASEAIILSKKDSRIKYLKNQKNQGLIKSLNKGLYLSKGIFLARMDADDIAMPTRLERQLEFMIEYKNVDILGSAIIAINENNEEQSQYWYTSNTIINNDTHKTILLLRNTLVHPTVFFRRASLRKFNLYYDKLALYSEDYKLWSDSSINRLVINTLNLPLLKYRRSPNQISHRYFLEQQKASLKIQLTLGLFYFEEEIKQLQSLYLKLLNKIPMSNNIELDQSKCLVNMLLKKNQIEKYFPSEKFDQQFSALIELQENNKAF